MKLWCTVGALLVHFWCTFKNHYISSKKHDFIWKNLPTHHHLVNNDVILKLHQKCTKRAPKVHHRINQMCPQLHHQFTNNLTNLVMQASFTYVIFLKVSFIQVSSIHESCIQVSVVTQASFTCKIGWPVSLFVLWKCTMPVRPWYCLYCLHLLNTRFIFILWSINRDSNYHTFVLFCLRCLKQM